MTLQRFLSTLVVSALGIVPAMAQDPVRIGFITTLSGGGGYLGQDIRDGFNLFVEMNDGRLGGVPVEVVVEDDAVNPGTGRQIADRFMNDMGINLLTGIVFSNVASAVVPEVLDSGALYVSPNAAPTAFAGEGCHPNYFVLSWQNESHHEAAGVNASLLGYRRMVILAPNYVGGIDALEGFKRRFEGEIIREIYTQLDQTDFSAEMAQIRSLAPDAVFQFHPGGLGIAFLRQYEQAGLLETIPMVVPGPSMDHAVVQSVGSAALGLNVTSQWNDDLDNEANQTFVSAFRERFGRMPTLYASQGYDTAQAIGAALRITGGSTDDTEAFRAAMLQADFPSVRGPFSFGRNQHPVQNWYSMRVEADAEGNPRLVTTGIIINEEGDFYADRCNL